MLAMQSEIPNGTIPAKFGDIVVQKNVRPIDFTQGIESYFWIISEMGPEKILLQLPTIVDEILPDLVINVGIAGMMGDDARIGDVVVATSIDYYSHRGAIADPPRDREGGSVIDGIMLGGKAIPVPQMVVSTCRRHLEGDLTLRDTKNPESLSNPGGILPEQLTRLIDEKLTHPKPRLHFGHIACGPFVSKSKDFKSILSNRDRNLLAIDMESAGVAMSMNEKYPDIPYLVIKGISDPGDARKKTIDELFHGENRSWATRNAFKVAERFVKKNYLSIQIDDRIESEASSGSIRQQLHNISVEHFLPRPYRNIAEQNRNKACTEYYSKLAEAVNLLGPKGEAITFEELARSLADGVRPHNISIYGRPGTGKTSLLSLFYLYLRDSLATDVSLPLPILVGIRPAIGFWHEKRIELTEDEQLNRIEQVLSLARTLAAVEPDTRFVVLFDSGEAENNFVSSMRNIVREFSLRVGACVVFTERTEKKRFEDNWLFCRTVPIPRSLDAVTKFSIAYCNLVGRHSDSEKLSAALMLTGLTDVDLFDASIAFLLIDDEKSERYRHEVFALADFTELKLKQLGVAERDIERNINAAGRYCLALERREAVAGAIDELPHPARAIARSHPRVHDYLVANVLIDDLLAQGDGEIKPSLCSVYPQRINSFVKELMCVNGRQKRCVRNALEIVQRTDSNFITKAFATYIIGRAREGGLQSEVKVALTKLIDEVRPYHVIADAETERDALLFARTVYISLAFLGDRGIQHEYVDLLVQSAGLDEINRGFHLEYFGDQPFRVDLPLQNRDNLGDCPLTYERLFARINSQQRSPLFEVELHTFLSLALQRHASDCLSREFRERVLWVLDSDDIINEVRSERLLDFILTVKFCINETPLRNAQIVNILLDNKLQPRKGWVKRGVGNPESVADHVYGALVIAHLFLPEHLNDAEYDKEKIIRMLMVHDMAEAITGDMLPEERGELEQDIEMGVFRSIRNLGVLPGLANQEITFQLFREFEERRTVNALIARDIDKIEMLMQFYRYLDSGGLDPKYIGEERDIFRMIRTEVGKNILSEISKWRRKSVRRSE